MCTTDGRAKTPDQQKELMAQYITCKTPIGMLSANTGSTLFIVAGIPGIR